MPKMAVIQQPDGEEWCNQAVDRQTAGQGPHPARYRSAKIPHAAQERCPAWTVPGQSAAKYKPWQRQLPREREL